MKGTGPPEGQVKLSDLLAASERIASAPLRNDQAWQAGRKSRWQPPWRKRPRLLEANFSMVKASEPTNHRLRHGMACTAVGGRQVPQSR